MQAFQPDYMRLKKKLVFFPEIDRLKNFYHSPARIVGYASGYAKCQRIVLVCLTILWDWRLKG